MHIAFNCSVIAGVSPQGIVCKPVMLSVARSTVLSLSVTKDEVSSEHVVSGKLAKYVGNDPVTGKTITIKINETTTGDYFEENVTTDNDGEFDLPKTFKALESGTAGFCFSSYSA
jgi:hypothetical protein